MHLVYREIGLLLTCWVLITATAAVADETHLPIISAEYGQKVRVGDGDSNLPRNKVTHDLVVEHLALKIT